MHPILLQIGPFALHTYSLFHGLGFLAGYWILRRYAEREGVRPELMPEFLVGTFFVTLIGARLFSVLFDGDIAYYFDRPVKIVAVWEGGLTFYGGFLAGIVYVWWFAKRHKIDLLNLSDMVSPPLAMGVAISRLGCFASGDSYGKATELPWAVVFRDPHSMAPLDIPLHPTQIYSVLTNLILFGLLALLYRRRRYRGQIAFWFVMGYGATRSFVEIFRDDPRGVYLSDWLSTSQIVSVILMATVSVFRFYHYRKKVTRPQSDMRIVEQ